ncbi:MAG: RnfH family protein [Pseudomonadota bacterium]
MNDREALIDVEVAYATPDRQKVIALCVPIGTTARAAARLSQMNRYFPDLELGQVPLGVWGRVVADDARLVAGDRVELYRTLQANPREQRRRRVETP